MGTPLRFARQKPRTGPREQLATHLYSAGSNSQAFALFSASMGLHIYVPSPRPTTGRVPSAFPLIHLSTHSLGHSLTISMASDTAGSNLSSVVYPQGQVEGFRTLSVVLALTGERNLR